MTRAPFRRTLRGGETGLDVEGVGRGLARAGFLSGLALFMSKTPAFRGTYNRSKVDAVNRIRKIQGRPQNGVYDLLAHSHLEAADAFDARAVWLMQSYSPPPVLCYPVPGDWPARVCQWEHETGGIPGNWAIDFCAGPGTGIVAVEKGTIYRLSGRPPANDTNDPSGVFGWSVYFTTPKGYVYYVTHLGWRPPELAPGLVVQPGDLIGKIGDQDFRPDHVHYGVSSPHGSRDAKARIRAVATAPRIL